MEFFHKVTRIRFMAMRRYCYAISACLIVASVMALYKPGLNFGIDYTGGIAVTLDYSKDADIDATRAALIKHGFPDAVVTSYGSSREVQVRLAPRQNITGNAIGQQVVDVV